MKWTTTAPEGEGFYWFRESAGRQAQVVWVSRALFVWLFGVGRHVSMTSLNGQWAGPIPEPQDTNTEES